MYVAPEAKVLNALANIAATSAPAATVDPDDPSNMDNWVWEPPCG